MLDREKALTMERKTLDGNQLKVIAMTAMTIDHVTCVLFPGYPKDWWILLLQHHRQDGGAHLLVLRGGGILLHP